MKIFKIAVVTAVLSAATVAAHGQGAPAAQAVQPATAEASMAVDQKYTAACEAKVSKELCGCVVAVAGIHVNDTAERQVFYDYMMGEVDKAKAQRAMFTPEKARTFNVALQKADSLLGEQCEKFREQPKPGAARSGAPSATPPAPQQ